MSETPAPAPVVPIPADVKDNSETVTDYAFMRHRSPDRGVRTPQDRDNEIRWSPSASRGWYSWHDVNPDGQRCRFDMIVNSRGLVTALLHTEYFTRAACITHDAYYAQHYASVMDTETGVATLPAPYCDECVSHLRRSVKGDDTFALYLSERLRVGQHG